MANIFTYCVSDISYFSNQSAQGYGHSLRELRYPRTENKFNIKTNIIT